VRTLRFYDKLGLLPPSGRTESGYRLYTDEDLLRLQQILALKFLGFSLDEIKTYLGTGPKGLRDALAEQKAMVRERRDQLDAVARALEETEELLRADGCDWECVVGVIRVIQMEQQTDWRRKYFTEEQLATIEDLGSRSYSAEARERMAAVHPGEWTEEDQQRVDARYAALHAGVKRLAAEGGDPAGPEAQALAAESLQLLEEFTRGNPQIEAGLSKWWENYQALPQEERPFPPPLTEEEFEFLERAKAIYRRGRSGSGGS
jgi:DNA-binding transcriptional MerR regulator